MGKKKAVKKTKKTSKKEEARQPDISIGLIGHVDHGKTTLVKALTNKWTDTHSEEIKRGITIRLGYADMSIFKCPKCKEPECYTVFTKCKICGSETELLRVASLVDAPGHESLMATMICGANIMDGAILLISANEECPQPQTQEHLMALEIMNIDKLIVVQNKIDLVDKAIAENNYKKIKEFLKNTKYKDAPIIPISALHSINIDLLLQAIQENIPTPKRDLDKDPIMLVARSFDINKPGTKPEKLTGGVLGGALKQGKLAVGDEIEILPGYASKEKKWKPLKSKITSAMAGGAALKEVHPGGSMAVMTELDPSIVKSDQLKLVVEPIKKGEFLMLNVNSAATVGIVNDISKKKVECTLKRPICAEEEAKITISRRVGQRWRLIGYGIIKK